MKINYKYIVYIIIFIAIVGIVLYLKPLVDNAKTLITDTDNIISKINDKINIIDEYGLYPYLESQGFKPTIDKFNTTLDDAQTAFGNANTFFTNTDDVINKANIEMDLYQKYGIYPYIDLDLSKITYTLGVPNFSQIYQKSEEVSNDRKSRINEYEVERRRKLGLMSEVNEVNIINENPQFVEPPKIPEELIQTPIETPVKVPKKENNKGIFSKVKGFFSKEEKKKEEDEEILGTSSLSSNDIELEYFMYNL
jgi:hypothetical protein